MSGPDFFQTRMGHTFFEGTVPKLARAVERLADAAERIAVALELQAKQSKRDAYVDESLAELLPKEEPPTP